MRFKQLLHEIRKNRRTNPRVLELQSFQNVCHKQSSLVSSEQTKALEFLHLTAIIEVLIDYNYGSHEVIGQYQMYEKYLRLQHERTRSGFQFSTHFMQQINKLLEAQQSFYKKEAKKRKKAKKASIKQEKD